MRVNYCPQCGKAGLRWQDPRGERPEEWAYTVHRFCPRCQVWVLGHNGPVKPAGITPGAKIATCAVNTQGSQPAGYQATQGHLFEPISYPVSA